MNANKKSKDIQEEKVPASAPVPNQVNLSKEESAIADLVKEQPSDVKVTKDYTRFNLLELPEECRPLHKVKYRFRWLNKKNVEPRLHSSVWTLCTRTNAPFIKPHRFKDHGAIEQGGMLLAFCSEEAGAMREAEPAERSAALVKHYTEDLKSDERRGFYSPENVGEEDESGLLEGRDF